MIKKLVELLGRGIRIACLSGRGTVQCLSCNFSMDISAGQDRTIPKSVPGNHKEASLKILLAEDNTLNRFFAKTLLEKQGHTVVEVETGREVLDKLAEDSFDVILMDIQMPELDGLETARLIRACERQEEFAGHALRGLLERVRANMHAALPIVAMTAHTMPEDRKRCLEAGMDGYVTKPLQPQEILAVISRVTRPQPPPVDRIEVISP